MKPQPSFTLRPARDDDVAFLLALRHRTMDGHLRAAGIDVAEEEHLRRIRYRFDCARIVLVAGQPAGLFKAVREGSAWQLIQIQIDPALQGTGLGARLVGEMVLEAERAGASIALDVLKVNRARRLYERHGFVVVGESEHSYDMLFRPAGQPAAPGT